MNPTYYAKVEDGVVTKVHVVSYQFLIANPDRYGAGSSWVETFHDGSQRGQYAGIGDIYDEELDRFITPRSEEE